MFIYSKDRYAQLVNLPVLKMDEGIGVFTSENNNTYGFSLRYNTISIDLSPECKPVSDDFEELLAQFKVAHIGRSRKVTHKGKELINNIQCNIEGHAYTLPMGLKLLLNKQNVVPIILMPNRVSDLNDPNKPEYTKLHILNLKNMIMNMSILSEIEDFYYDDYFLGGTADLFEVKPLGKLVDKHSH